VLQDRRRTRVYFGDSFQIVAGPFQPQFHAADPSKKCNNPQWRPQPSSFQHGYLVLIADSIGYMSYSPPGALWADKEELAMRAWIALAFGGEENPYPDEPGVAYGFDDRVQNHRQVRPGDLLFLRNRSRLEGIGRVARIDEGHGNKMIRRCPICGNTRIHQRRRANLSYRCANGHEFDHPAETRLPVISFRAYFDGDFVSVTRRISPDELKPFQLRNSTQLAIMPG
jgi:hypothetical protein